MEKTRRTPEASLKEVFLRASEAFPGEKSRSEAVGEALYFLQRGFEAHYGGPNVVSGDEEILIGDTDYAWSVETIARLDEPRFVAVASRMIRDGAGCIASGGNVTVEFWIPHLAGLLNIISGEGEEPSEERIRRAVSELST